MATAAPLNIPPSEGTPFPSTAPAAPFPTAAPAAPIAPFPTALPAAPAAPVPTAAPTAPVAPVAPATPGLLNAPPSVVGNNSDGTGHVGSTAVDNKSVGEATAKALATRSSEPVEAGVTQMAPRLNQKQYAAVGNGDDVEMENGFADDVADREEDGDDDESVVSMNDVEDRQRLLDEGAENALNASAADIPIAIAEIIQQAAPSFRLAWNIKQDHDDAVRIMMIDANNKIKKIQTKEQDFCIPYEQIMMDIAQVAAAANAKNAKELVAVTHVLLGHLRKAGIPWRAIIKQEHYNVLRAQLNEGIPQVGAETVRLLDRELHAEGLRSTTLQTEMVKTSSVDTHVTDFFERMKKPVITDDELSSALQHIAALKRLNSEIAIANTAVGLKPNDACVPIDFLNNCVDIARRNPADKAELIKAQQQSMAAALWLLGASDLASKTFANTDAVQDFIQNASKSIEWFQEREADYDRQPVHKELQHVAPGPLFVSPITVDPPKVVGPVIPHLSPNAAPLTPTYISNGRPGLRPTKPTKAVIQPPLARNDISSVGKLVGLQPASFGSFRAIVNVGTDDFALYKCLTADDHWGRGAIGQKLFKSNPLPRVAVNWQADDIESITDMVVVPGSGSLKRRPITYFRILFRRRGGFGEEPVKWATRSELLKFAPKKWLEAQEGALRDSSTAFAEFLQRAKEAGVHPDTWAPLTELDFEKTPWLFKNPWPVTMRDGIPNQLGPADQSTRKMNFEHINVGKDLSRLQRHMTVLSDEEL